MGTPVTGSEHPSLPPAWTRNGQPLPFMQSGFIASAIDWQHPPIATTPGFMAALQDEEAVAQATIPVEHTRGAILMLSGQDDQMWPSPRLAEIAVRRLQQYNFAFPVEHVSYPHAGHLFPLPYLPTTITHSRHPILKVDFAYGGTPAGNAFAGADSWSKVVAFVRKNLE
jgi:dienelactone hydrolase